MFSDNFIRDNFLNISDKQVLLDDDAYVNSIYENINPELAANTIDAESLDQINTKIMSNVRKKNIGDEASQSNGSLDYVLKSMTSSLRVING